MRAAEPDRHVGDRAEDEVDDELEIAVIARGGTDDERAEAGRDRVHREVDDPVARRAPAARAVTQLARKEHALPARQRDVLVVGGRHGHESVRTR